jgi:Lipocalin-like domain
MTNKGAGMISRRLSMMAALVAMVAPQFALGQQAGPPPAIVGTWLLETIVDVLEDGTLTHWMGERPTGAIIYSASGHMSVQFMRDPRPLPPAVEGADRAKLAGADPFAELDAATLRDLLRGYYAYSGRYEVAQAGDAITHFVETSLRPGEVGIEYRREIRIEGDRLFISLNAEVDGVPRRRVLTWRRASMDGDGS